MRWALGDRLVVESFRIFCINLIPAVASVKLVAELQGMQPQTVIHIPPSVYIIPGKSNSLPFLPSNGFLNLLFPRMSITYLMTLG
jgi:hypothetical protein